MSILFILFILPINILAASRLPNNSGIHFQLYRRGLRFASQTEANLTYLTEVLHNIESRYLQTRRETHQNQVIRLWSSDVEDARMLDDAGLYGRWYIKFDVGNPSQTLDVDLDMLSPDFYSIMTSGGGGSKFDTFGSLSYESSGDDHVHPYCLLATDLYSIAPGESIKLQWPICQASHSSRHTLYKSGTILGLAPTSQDNPSTLSHINGASLLDQLIEKNLIRTAVWSVTLLDSASGVLSLGGTIAQEMEEIKARTELQLKYIDHQNGSGLVAEELTYRMNLLGTDIEDQFKWLSVRGASGWWTGLISAVWVDGIKILKNQPFVLDVNCPFIIAPPSAFSQLYSAIGASTILQHPFEHLSLFPCLNAPEVAFELAGWRFPIMRTGLRSDIIHGPAGGRFSLGKMSNIQFEGSTKDTTDRNSGLCIGIVVRSSIYQAAREKQNGMKNVWILGEPFFREIGMVFDIRGSPRVGFRIY